MRVLLLLLLRSTSCRWLVFIRLILPNFLYSKFYIVHGILYVHRVSKKNLCKFVFVRTFSVLIIFGTSHNFKVFVAFLPKNYQNWWKFDEVLTKANWHCFVDTVYRIWIILLCSLSVCTVFVRMLELCSVVGDEDIMSHHKICNFHHGGISYALLICKLLLDMFFLLLSNTLSSRLLLSPRKHTHDCTSLVVRPPSTAAADLYEVAYDQYHRQQSLSERPVKPE